MEQAGNSALSPLVVRSLLITLFCTAVCFPAQLIYTNVMPLSLHRAGLSVTSLSGLTGKVKGGKTNSGELLIILSY